MKATNTDGKLLPTGCYITVGASTIPLNILPEISDRKSATYNDENIMGASFPIKTFGHGDNRTLSISVQFYADVESNLLTNANYCRLLQSAVYPRNQTNNGLPFMPPPICKFKCSGLISACELNVIIKSYSLKLLRDTPWHDTLMIPYFFTMDLELDVVNDSSMLPGQEKILGDIPGQSSCSRNPPSSSTQTSSSPQSNPITGTPEQ